MSRLPLFLCVCGVVLGQNLPPKENAHDRALRLRFEMALGQDPGSALQLLPHVIDASWIGEIRFRDACALEQLAEQQSSETEALAYRLTLAAGLHYPALALRESGCYFPLQKGRQLFERFVMAAPAEAMSLASGDTHPARAFRELLSGDTSPEFPVLIRLAENASIDLPRRQRIAVLVGPIARGQLSFEAALKIAGDSPLFFATVLDMRTAATGADAVPLDRVLENESLLLCRAVKESLNRTISDLAPYRARDLYAVLALGRAEATPEVFAAVFDRLLLRKWTAEASKSQSITALLDQTQNWGLRDFAAGALDARRLDRVLAIAGPDLITRITTNIDRASDPLKEGMRLAEIVDATSSAPLLDRMRSIVSSEYARCNSGGDMRCAAIYGLLAAKLGNEKIGEAYAPLLRSSKTLDSGVLYGEANNCIERHFFYDDSDGVESFTSFLHSYERDPAWEIEDEKIYVHLTGRGPGGRRIQIFANVPVDIQLPKNRMLDGEARRRQQAISDTLEQRGLVATVIVHRGHSFWTERTIGYVTNTSRLVILGSCGGLSQVHRVIEASHQSEVIATRGVGETEINDAILKAVNDRILNGDRRIEWSQFWKELSGTWGRSALFKDYVAPHQDSAIVFLRAYYRYFDAL